MRRHLFSSALVCAALAFGGCGPSSDLDAVEVDLELALTVEVGDFIEVTVFEQVNVDCARATSQGMEAVEDESVGQSIKVADALNDGPETITLEDLPATGPLGEKPLSFWGRVIRPAEGSLAEDCVDDVRIPEGGRVTVNLQLVDN